MSVPVPRERYLEKIAQFTDRPFIKVLTGIRRCGKSTIQRLLIERLRERGVPDDRICYINKESVEFDEITDYRQLDRYIESFWKKKRGKKYLFIDEVQEIEEWEKTVGSLFAAGTCDIVLTGSNARLLSSELATRLSGRHVEIPIYPLSFLEFLRFRACDPSSSAREEEFARYLRYGGMPAIHALELTDEPVYQYLNALFNTIFLRDIIARHAVKDLAQIELVARFLFDNCGNITTTKRIADYFKGQGAAISTNTVQNFLTYFQQAFLAHRVRRYDLKGLKHLEFYEKFYMGDIGLRHGFIGYRDKDIGGILENIVFLELLVRGYTVSVGKYDDREIDFIAEKQNKKMYVQVAYLLAAPETVEREFRALEKIDDNYPKMVLSLDKFFVPERKGILWKNLLDFLVEDERTI